MLTKKYECKFIETNITTDLLYNALQIKMSMHLNAIYANYKELLVSRNWEVRRIVTSPVCCISLIDQ